LSFVVEVKNSCEGLQAVKVPVRIRESIVDDEEDRDDDEQESGKARTAGPVLSVRIYIA
jgi:hypothetical protein